MKLFPTPSSAQDNERRPAVGANAPSRLQKTHLARFFSSSASLSECILKSVRIRADQTPHPCTHTHWNRSCLRRGVFCVSVYLLVWSDRKKNQFAGTFAARGSHRLSNSSPLMYSENAFFRVATFIFFTAARRVQIRSKKNLIKGNDTPPTWEVLNSSWRQRRHLSCSATPLLIQRVFANITLFLHGTSQQQEWKREKETF